MHLFSVIFACCLFAALAFIAWQLHRVLRQLTAMRSELKALRKNGDPQPTVEPTANEKPSEAFRSTLLAPPPVSANPALTINSKKEPDAVVATGEMARLVERFKGPKG